MLRADDLLAQLAAPDPVGVALALFRTRAYRFSDDPRHYVLAEWLEERFINGLRPQRSTLAYVHTWLEAMRMDGTALPFSPDVAHHEDLDVDEELAQRSTDGNDQPTNVAMPAQIIFIVGAPRSGTSHLHNLLAYTGHFAYFTTASCWAWSTRNLRRPERRSFELLDRRIFDVDNKTTRIVPALVMPAEAEDIHARAIPTYRHHGGHTYTLVPAGLRDADLLRNAVGAHLAHFGRTQFLCKSPFNSLRIPILEDIWADSARYIHIVRDQKAAAASVQRNHFQYLRDGRPLAAIEARDTFVSNVQTQAPPDRLLTVRFAELQDDPTGTVRAITRWLGRCSPP